MTTIAVPVIKGIPQLSLENSLIMYTVVCKQYMELKIATVASAALCGCSPINKLNKINTCYVEINFHICM